MRQLDGLEHRLAIGHIQRQGQDGVTIGGDELAERFRVARGGGNLVAALEGGFRPGAAEATRSACDEPYFALSHDVDLRILSHSVH